MQGFNKYYPPDYDGEKHGSLNSYRGKHALGDRARKIDQGILITRFELPFNIWCGTCDNHIGMGVRYNAEKKKIGNYYSTPIFSFRCKCHLCSGWFEIQTDPKNTRYVVVSGARQKDEEWNPEENGGFAVHDTDGKPENADPLAALEKSTDAQNHHKNVQVPRLESLMDVSEQYNSDPYALSQKVRKQFRQDKKIRLEKEKADVQFKDRYALPTTLKLAEDDEKALKEAKDQWNKARQEKLSLENQRRKLPPVVSSITSLSGSRTHASSSRSSGVASLRARILNNTAKQSAKQKFGGTSSQFER
ncbi:Protein saf4 [Marasmius tenuissimus]|uniref:Protein saf4 n=1 Tax=Marasmius tenuissimus TaxID=585030 RepID=A0ABR2ZQS9_9AGAR